MRCIYCGTPLSAIDYCTGCGADVTRVRKMLRDNIDIEPPL